MGIMAHRLVIIGDHLTVWDVVLVIGALPMACAMLPVRGMLVMIVVGITAIASRLRHRPEVDTTITIAMVMTSLSVV